MTGEKKTENISRRGERTGRTSRTGNTYLTGMDAKKAWKVKKT